MSDSNAENKKKPESTEPEEETMEIESVINEPEENATPHLGETKQLEEKIKALEAQIEKEKKEQLYIRAEADTFRRRVIKERSEMLKYAGERAFSSLLGVLDNFERALETEVKPENLESFVNGVKLISDELRNVLKREGVEEVPPKDNAFDPNLFEAISSEETTDKSPGQITKVFRKAYRLHDRVIRPGQVVVAKAPSTNREDSENDGEETD